MSSIQDKVVLIIIKASKCPSCKTFTSKVWPGALKKIKDAKLALKVEISEDGKNKNIPSSYLSSPALKAVPAFLMLPMQSFVAQTLDGAVWRLGTSLPNSQLNITDEMAISGFFSWVSNSYNNILSPPIESNVKMEASSSTGTLEMCKKVRSRNRR
jgi:hypothetical protein